MAQRHHAQYDFSGGEISTRMLMRADTEVYAKSLLSMENMHPTLQGSAERSPGTRFLYDTQKSEARIIPYMLPDNTHAFVELAPGSIEIKSKFGNLLQPAVRTNTAPLNVQALTPIRRQIVPNGDIVRSAEPWDISPALYTGANGDKLGVEWSAARNGILTATSRIWRAGDRPICTMTNTAEVTYPTTNVTIDFYLEYLNNFSSVEAEYTTTVKVGRTVGGSQVLNFNFEGPPGTIKDLIFSKPVNNGAAWTGTLYITVTVEARATSRWPHSTPQFELRRMNIWADDELDISEDVIGGETPPWTASELDDVHFIQSPYGAPLDDPTAPVKQLVLCHPNYLPHMLFFNTDANLTLPPFYPNPGDIPAGYVLIKMPFENQPQWRVQNYPNTCTSFNGRLILGGGQYGPNPGQVISPETETVWGTEVGNWLAFSDPTASEVNADDSIEFTTIYRSPIQWLYGQKNLLVGAEEMEFSASADGIFNPGDLGVEMHSTHGSAHVQPVGFGRSVMFASDAGTKVRELSFQNEDRGWVAPDLTLLHPELCAAGIVRMVRMRNPHQMLAVLLRTGQIALLHTDQNLAMAGWSRLNVTAGTRVRDLCVITDDEGVDVLVLLVARVLEGSPVLYVEAIPNWTDANEWDYVTSGSLILPDTPTATFTGLDHLEGVNVQVVADRTFVGTFLVENGSITLTTQTGEPVEVASALIGRAMPCRMETLPLFDEDPGSTKRLKDIGLRIRNSTRPRINGERPRERAPARIMDKSQELAAFEDVKVSNLGWTTYETITIEETAPLRCEVLGVYGKLTAHSA